MKSEIINVHDIPTIILDIDPKRYGFYKVFWKDKIEFCYNNHIIEKRLRYYDEVLNQYRFDLKDALMVKVIITKNTLDWMIREGFTYEDNTISFK